MKPTSRGRPAKVNNNDFIVYDLSVKFLSVKADKYDNSIAYFKIVDDKFKSKLKVLLALSGDPTLILPLWKTDKEDYILKVKSKHVHLPPKHLKTSEVYDINFEFLPFEFENKEGKTLKGYYAKVVSLGSKSVEPPPEAIEGIDALDELDI